MGRSSYAMSIEAVAAILVLLYASATSASSQHADLFTLSAAMVAFAFGLALLVLGFFNVWLPRGDAVDTTAAVAFAATLLLGHPGLTVAVVLLAKCATVAMKPKGHTLQSVVEQVSRRTLLISATFMIAHAAAPTILSNQEPRLDWTQLAFVAGGAAIFVAADVFIEQLHASAWARLPVWSLLSGVVRLQGWMLAAEMSVAVLAVVMFPALHYWGLLVTVGLLLIMRQSFALLLEVRASYTATVEVLARSLEAYDPNRRGHGERVAGMAAHAGRLIGFHGAVLENLTYAALFHDVGRLGTDEDTEAPSKESAEVLSSVGFLSGALPILHILDTNGEAETSLDEEAVIAAYLIAVFSALDTESTMGVAEDTAAAANIGSRLYSATRRNVDRVIGRVEGDIRSGRLRLSSLSEAAG